MDIIGCVNELDSLKTEIENLRLKMISKRERLEELQDCLDVWLEKTGQTEFKYNNKIIYKQTKKKTQKLKQAEKDENLLNLLKGFGISDCKFVMKRIRRSEEHTSELQSH